MLEGSNVMVQNGLFRYTPRPLNFIMGEIWAFAYYFSVVSIVIQFWYRYLYVCRDRILSTINHALLLIAGAGIALFYNFLIYLVIYPPPMEKLPGTMGIKLHEFFDYGDPESHYTQVAMLGRPDPWYVCISFCGYTVVFMEAVCYVVIIFCSTEIRTALRTMTTKTQEEKRRLNLNRQINITLILQAILPLSAVLIGIFCVFVCTTAVTMDKLLSFYITAYLTAFVPFIPVLNPLITLVIVKPYRNHVWRMLSRRKMLSRPTESRINPTSNTSTNRPKAAGSIQSAIQHSDDNKV
ncbi:serpentine type 7TM GPCR chemoreceptor str domain-containing protein [Ditylenchus destructor]|nr:serpentine type 7TM GPCR chemoreceptor str domain-containing protein [Ditylenchus destructor]